MKKLFGARHLFTTSVNDTTNDKSTVNDSPVYADKNYDWKNDKKYVKDCSSHHNLGQPIKGATSISYS